MGTNDHLCVKEVSKVLLPSIIKQNESRYKNPLAFIVDFYLNLKMCVFKILTYLAYNCHMYQWTSVRFTTGLL